MTRDVERLVSWSELYVPALSVSHIPGMGNLQGGYLSQQHLDPQERYLFAEVFQDLCTKWGI